jgi:FkbM family methyltransferase
MSIKLVDHAMNRCDKGASGTAKAMVSFANGRSVKVILDIGANVGIYSLRLAEAFPGSTIHAFEPMLDNFSVLCENARLNSAPIITNKFGIFNKDCEMALGFPSGRDRSNTGLYSAKLPNAVGVCKFKRLGDYISGNGIVGVNIIKIDIEGCELEVLEDNIEILQSVMMINIEVNSAFGQSEKIRSILKGSGMDFIQKTDKNTDLWGRHG